MGLAGQREDVYEFLLRTSILRELNPALCAAVTGRSDAITVMDQLERGGVFLPALDLAGHRYRYHPLFGELLRHELRLHHPTAVAGLHLSAARWCEADGAIAEAVRHYVAAGVPRHATDLVTRTWRACTNSGRPGTVESWLDTLPDPLVRADPSLCAARAQIRLDLGRLDEVDTWLAAGDRAAACADTRAAADGRARSRPTRHRGDPWTARTSRLLAGTGR